ncbi:hypothetical protein Hanom_Chr01g00019861 [Helianthus anomalus]
MSFYTNHLIYNFSNYTSYTITNPNPKPLFYGPVYIKLSQINNRNAYNEFKLTFSVVPLESTAETAVLTEVVVLQLTPLMTVISLGKCCGIDGKGKESEEWWR